MQEEDEAGQARQAKRRADARLEAGLRRLGLLDPDDDIADAICGPRAVLIGYREEPAAEPRASTLDRGCCCAFSSRRLYFPHAKLAIGLEWLWRAESWGEDLAVVFSAGQELTAVCVMTDGLAAADQVADFAGRLLAQRDRRVAELPEERRDQFGRWSADLERRGIPEAAAARSRADGQAQARNRMERRGDDGPAGRLRLAGPPFLRSPP